MTTYAVSPGWRVLFTDMGVAPLDVLRRAGLPDDLLNRGLDRLPPARFFALWEALEACVAAHTATPLPVLIATSVTAESFDPPLFAALCSRDLVQAAQRIASYKPLVGPMRLNVDAPADLRLGFVWPPTPRPPEGLVATELMFWIALARIGTRSPVVPAAVSVPVKPAGHAEIEAWLGCRLTEGPAQVRFHADDARRPFLTANEAMWTFFEPELRVRLAHLAASATTTERTRATLLELLPTADSTVEHVARRLAMSPRTLQRRLREEGTTFQDVLAATREGLARHYLRASALPAAEISFLLGYEDPNSFYRAFHAWTGSTPEAVRAAG